MSMTNNNYNDRNIQLQNDLIDFHRWLVDNAMAVEGEDSYRLAGLFLKERAV